MSTDDDNRGHLLAALRNVTWGVADDPKLLAGADTIPLLLRRPGPPGHKIERLDQSAPTALPASRKP